MLLRRYKDRNKTEVKQVKETTSSAKTDVKKTTKTTKK